MPHCMLWLGLSSPGIRVGALDHVAGSCFEVEVQVVRQKVGVACGHHGPHRPLEMLAVESHVTMSMAMRDRGRTWTSLAVDYEGGFQSTTSRNHVSRSPQCA